MSINPEHQGNQKTTLADNPWLRREAGEGWLPQGMNETLLETLVAREEAIDRLAEGDSSDETLRNTYQAKIEHVRETKEKLGIGEPSALGEDKDSSITE